MPLNEDKRTAIRAVLSAIEKALTQRAENNYGGRLDVQIGIHQGAPTNLSMGGMSRMDYVLADCKKNGAARD